MGAETSSEATTNQQGGSYSAQGSFQDAQSVYSAKVLESRCLFSSPVIKETNFCADVGKFGSNGSGSTLEMSNKSFDSDIEEEITPSSKTSPDREIILAIARVCDKEDYRSVAAINPDMESYARLNKISVQTEAYLKQLGAFQHDEALQTQLLEGIDHQKLLFGKFRSKNTRNTYEGTVYDGVPHGYGIFVSCKGEYLEGYFKSGYAHGKCLRASESAGGYNGYIGDNMTKNGRGKFITVGKEQTTTIWQADKPNGVVEIFDFALNRLIFKGKMVNGRKEGRGFFYDRKKDSTYIGDFRDGLYYGFGKLEDPEGEYKGYFLNGQKDGPGQQKGLDGRAIQGIWSKGMFQTAKMNSSPELSSPSNQRVPYSSKPMPPNPNRF